MKTPKFLIYSFLFIGMFIIGCEDFSEIEVPPIDQRTSELLASYVAIGNSLTAGLQNNSLYESSQKYSFPALIARQGGVEDFQQPLIQDPGIPGRMRIDKLDPFTTKADPPNPAPLNANLARPYNNLGIPGAILFDAIDTENFATKSAQRNNPFFSLILRDSQLGSSVFEQAIAQNPTLLTVWFGNNDILSYALSGGTTVLPTTANPELFTAIYSQLGSALAQTAGVSGLKVAIANIPDVSIIPFVNAIPPFIIHPETGEPVMPFIGVSPQDKILLTALEFINQGFGIPEALGGNNQPLPGHVVLTVEEQQFIADRVGNFNQTIAAIASQFDFALVDIQTRFNQIHANGYPLGSATLTTEFVTGGIFSLDGVHPTSVGSGLIANEFIQAINQKFDVAIPEVQIGAIPPSIEFVAKGLLTPVDFMKLDPGIFQDVVRLYTSY